jgi:DNA-binding LytR/AlgR family response regulator
MYHIAVVDDEPKTRIELVSYIERFSVERNMEIETALFSDGDELLARKPGNYEIILLDIEMERVDGLETARQIRLKDERTVIVFITGYIQYAVQGYSVNAMSFLVKPVNYATLSAELEKAISRTIHMKSSFLCLRTGEGMVQLAIEEITYIETVGRKVCIHTIGNRYFCWETMHALEKKLLEKGFVRCHKAYLVNLAHLERVLENGAVVAGDEVLVSRDKRKELMHALVRFASERA